MDPRLSPKLNLSAPRPAQDIAPHKQLSAAPVALIPQPPEPAPAAQPQVAAPTPAPAASVEFVNSIPMAQPGLTAQAPAPPHAAAVPSPNIPSAPIQQTVAPPPKEDELEKILQAVNNRVQTPAASKRSKPRLPKIGPHLPKLKLPALTNSQRPIGAMAAVTGIFLALSIVAVIAYRQSGKTTALAHTPGKVGTSYTAGDEIQANGGMLVHPADLDDFSQTLSQKLNGLNDSQDFDSGSLSQANIGL